MDFAQHTFRHIRIWSQYLRLKISPIIATMKHLADAPTVFLAYIQIYLSHLDITNYENGKECQKRSFHREFSQWQADYHERGN